MKSIMKLCILSIAIITAAWSTPQKSFSQAVITYQVFYDDLSPHGTWINYSNYGYVWSPSLGPSFRPYATAGHWVMTEYGWTWVSDYAWGWAPFHYGRWEIVPTYGWIWIPDNVWGPGWVEWRSAPGYYGWVPRGYKHNNDFDDRWVFVNNKDFNRVDIDHYYVVNNNNGQIKKTSSPLGNSGPDKIDVQKFTGKKVAIIPVQNNDKHEQTMNNGELKTYKPTVEKTNGNSENPAPKEVKSSNAATDKKGETVPVKKQEPQQQDKKENVAKPDNQNGAPNNNDNNTGKPKKEREHKHRKGNTNQASGN